MTDILEIARFQLAPGVAGTDLPDRSAAIERWLAAQPGFRSRVLVGPDQAGRYTDVVRWASHEQAQAAAKALMAAPEAGPFLSAIDPESVDMAHAPIVLEIPG